MRVNPLSSIPIRPGMQIASVCPATGGWSRFTGDVQQTIMLNSDTNNVIKFVNGKGGVNLVISQSSEGRISHLMKLTVSTIKY
ncbi:MAG: hypothetical protein WCD89_19380 [Anaerocolumna sp.]